MKTSNKAGAFGFLFLTFFFWGSVYVAGKMVPQLPAALVACLRCAVAAIPLMLMARPHIRPVDRKDWKYFAIVGGFGYFLTIFLIQAGISLAGASMASLINSLTPVTVTIFAALFLKEKITPVKILCLVLALVGAAIITQGASAGGQMLGIALVLLSVISWSLASVAMRLLTAKYPPIMVTAYGMVISLIGHIPAGVASVMQAGGVEVDLKSVLVVLYLGLIGSGLAQYTWTSSLSKLPASTCSLFYPLQPLFSALLGALILKETFAPTFFVGMVIISADVIISTLETRRLSRLEQASK